MWGKPCSVLYHSTLHCDFWERKPNIKRVCVCVCILCHMYLHLALQNSSLEFKLHRLQFIDLIQRGHAGQAEAIHYARTHFQQFINKHEKGN